VLSLNYKTTRSRQIEKGETMDKGLSNPSVKQERIDIAFAIWALCIPWWHVISIKNFTVPGRRFINKLRSRGYFHCLGRIMKCGNWEPQLSGFSYGSMLSTLILPIGKNLQTKKK
jgi:hypothetical protein